MTKGEFLDYLTKEAKDFRNAPDFITVNEHLTGINEANMPSAAQIDGILVAFINRIGIHQGIDYALKFSDLEQ